jgi:hypothetical protein
LDVTTDPVGATSTYQGGIALNPLGQVHVTTTVPAIKQGPITSRETGEVWSLNGNAVLDYSGELSVSLSGAIGTYVSTPDSPANSITGDIDIRARVIYPVYISAGQKFLCSKYAANQWAYMFSLNAAGTLNFQASADGTTQVIRASTAVPSMIDGKAYFFRVTRKGPLVRFYISDDGKRWTKVGDDITDFLASPFFNSTAGIELGSWNNGAVVTTGVKAFGAQIYNGIEEEGGVLAVDFQATDTPIEPSRFVNGFMVSPTGQLVISSDPTVDFLEGLPRTATGALKAQTDTVPDPKDPFVGGIRVGPLGGVYTTLVAPPVGDPPINTVRPDVTGDLQVGATLTCSTGTWDNTPTAYAYQWFQEGAPLIGETNATHVVTAGDDKNTLSCRVTATNAAGGASAFSNPVRIGGARYNYTTSTNQFPGPGNMTNATGSLFVRMDRVDADGIDHYSILDQLRVGDSVFVGTTEGVLAGTVSFNGTTATLPMVSWTGPTDGEYTVRVELAP